MTLIALLRCRRAATAAEFALVLPLLLILLIGMLDAGRLMWTWNSAEKAAQMGVRYAVVTDMVPADLPGYDFALEDGIPGGNAVPTGSFDSTLCDDADCSGNWGYDGTAFGNIVQRVAFFLPAAGAANVEIEYRNVGLGYAGDPNGPDVSPLVTVRLKGLQFQPILFQFFGGSVVLPDFESSLTGEDMSCDPNCFSN